jgi:uncharacterized membrane protein YraQ (UPF0718 family)
MPHHASPLDLIGHAAAMAFFMGWEMFWPLVLGFALSGVVQAVVSKKEVGRLMPDASPRSLAVACGLGAASSSCSFAATALARSTIRKGADFTAAMAFEMASTNLVLELGVVLVAILGWRFMAAEAIAAPLMIAILAVLMRAFIPKRVVAGARAHADKGIAGRMEGHAGMDMTVTGGSFLGRVFSARGRTAISHYFIMDLTSVGLDIAIGLVLAGFIAVVVPADVWTALFLVGHPIASRLAGPLVGPLVAVFSFVCSVGNVPLAAVLWSKGCSFGGVIAFLFADLLTLPILDIHRKYYGGKMAALLFVTFYAAMAAAALAIDTVFEALGLVPATRVAGSVVPMAVRWDATTALNLVFAALGVALFVRFLRTGGPEMLRHMSAPAPAQPGHGGHGAHVPAPEGPPDHHDCCH